MERTLFAGLTVLEPEEPFSTDDYSFQAQNPEVTDRLLEVGAVTHRHDAHTKLADPLVAPSAAVTASGTIPADSVFEFAYTLIDADRGETLESPEATIATGPAILEPEEPVVLLADYSSGFLRPDTYYYGLVYTDGAGGETELGAIATVDVDPGYASASVLISGLASGMALASAAGWRLYRARGGEQFTLLAAGGGDTLTDDGTLCPDCTDTPVLVNTTQRNQGLRITIPPLPSGATEWRLYGTTLEGQWDTFSLLASGVASGIVDLPSYVPEYGRPPSRSLALRGAAKINPDTDMLDFPWKRPVASAGALPASGNVDGDVRETLDTHHLWGWDEDDEEWSDLTSGSGHIIRDEGTALAQRDILAFLGSGVTVTDDGAGGRTVVTIPGGSGGASGGSAFWGDPVADDEDFDTLIGEEGEVRLSLTTGTIWRWIVDVGNPNGGYWGSVLAYPSATLLPQRALQESVLDLASGASGVADLALGVGWTLYQLYSNKECRVRIYATEAQRSADEARAVGVAPTGDHGLLAEESLLVNGTAPARRVQGVYGPVVVDLAWIETVNWAGGHNARTLLNEGDDDYLPHVYAIDVSTATTLECRVRNADASTALELFDPDDVSILSDFGTVGPFGGAVAVTPGRHYLVIYPENTTGGDYELLISATSLAHISRGETDPQAAKTLTPMVAGANMHVPPDSSTPATVTNDDDDGNVVVSAVHVTTEAEA